MWWRSRHETAFHCCPRFPLKPLCGARMEEAVVESEGHGVPLCPECMRALAYMATLMEREGLFEEIRDVSRRSS